MAKIISQFASTMSASQRAQVAALLKEGEDGGKYANQQAFLEDLARLSSQLESINTPLFTFFEVLAGELVDNGRINYEIRMMRMDMETIFSELDALQDAVLGHRLLMDQHIGDVKNALAALDTGITTAELLADESEYNLGVVNTFNMLGATGLSRADAFASDLYYDLRELQTMGSAFDMTVDVHQEGLVLPTIEKTNSPIVGIQLYEGDDTTPSDLQMDPDNNDLFNILEEGDGLFWVHSILKLDEDAFQNPILPPETGAVAAIRLDLGGFRSINSVTLVPFVDTQFDLDQILYLDTDGNWYPMLSDQFVLTERAVIYFEKVEARELILQLSQKSYTELVDFSYSDAPEDEATIYALVDQATAYGVSFGTGPQTQYAKGYLYTIGFDHISADLTTFEHKGIYVSKKTTTTRAPVEIAIKTDIAHSESSTGLKMDDVEFVLSKYNYNEDGALVYIETLPMLPSTTTVEKEVLIADTAGVGQLRLFPLLPSIQVYRDHTLLTLGVDYQLSWDGGLNFYDTPPSSPDGATIRLHVKILNYLPASSYTVSYTAATTHPTLSGEKVWLNDLQTVFIDSNSIKFEYPASLDSISYSDLYLSVITRSTDLLSTRNSPIIAEYSLLVRESDAV